MPYAESISQINALRNQIRDLHGQIRTLQAGIAPQLVDDYEFEGPDGSVRLASLFDDQDTLIVIHNMGAGCNYCSLWADGFNGLTDQLESRAAFVVTSPDAPAAQAKIADKRGWRFRLVSHAGNSFAADMGYTGERGMQPGVSVFKQEGDQIVRVADASFGPGDDFCALWHLFDLLPEGADGWQPLK